MKGHRYSEYYCTSCNKLEESPFKNDLCVISNVSFLKALSRAFEGYTRRIDQLERLTKGRFEFYDIQKRIINENNMLKFIVTNLNEDGKLTVIRYNIGEGIW
jgi:hypothetical protein